MNIFKIGNKELHIGESKIHWENRLFDSCLEQPSQIRFGISPIEFDMFTIGSKYQIDLRNEKNDKFSIILNSYFGIGKPKKHHLYEQIADIIWKNFFAEPFGELANEWENGQTITIGKFDIDSYGLTRKVGMQGVTMLFEEMQLLPRYDHLLINSKSKPDKYLKLIYLEDWNWPLINEILNRKIKTNANKSYKI